MPRFVQLHLLTTYPPANLNRDDLGRPKTAVMGGSQRLRVSSQSLKRAWRTSDVFARVVGDENKGVRSRTVAFRRVYEPLVAAGVKPETAMAAAQAVRGAFETKDNAGKESKEKNPEKALANSQLIFLSPKQLRSIDDFVNRIREGAKVDAEALKKELLTNEAPGADVALFGRMMSADQNFSIEAAAQVAHAISTHRVTIEDDYFSAVDELNAGAEDAGAGHIGTNEFAAGVFYLYVCVDRALLRKHLKDPALEAKALQGLLEAAATTSPGGKKASYGSSARASYVLVEKGDQQPRTLAGAFLKAVDGGDYLQASIGALEKTLENMDKVYGACAESRQHLNAATGEGSLSKLLAFAAE